MNNSTYHVKFAIAVSGAAETGHCSTDALDLAKQVGQEIAKNDCILMTGATSGIPFWAAKGAKEENGIVIGLSPAASERAHRNSYHLPVDYHDVIIYTGSEYTGRNLQMIRAADAIVILCGRIGTLNEFTIAFEDQKPIGVLEKTGGTADMVRAIVEGSHRGPGKIIYEKDPKILIEKIIALVKKEKGEL